MAKYHKIPGFSNYKVSKKARVKRFEGGIWIPMDYHINNGYPKCWIRDDSGKRHKIKLSRIVALAWIPNPKNYPLVRHLDDNPMNNYYKNLAWGNNSMNALDCIKNGNYNNGYTKGTIKPKFTPGEYRTMHYLFHDKGHSYEFIAHQFNISRRYINKVILNPNKYYGII